MAGEKILVVEDEPVVGMEIKEDLERAGFSVPEVVCAGEDALEAARRHSPDLVLMDIHLDGALDGIETATRLKSALGMPLLYLTAYSDPQTLERAAATEPESYLLKPFEERELVVSVRLALAKARLATPKARELEGLSPLAEALDRPALLADLEGRIVHANAAALAFLGLGAGEGGRLRGEPLDAYAAQGVAVGSEPIVGLEGRPIGNLVSLDRMSAKERLHLESSVEESNRRLEALMPAPEAAGPGFEIGSFLLASPSGTGDLVDAFRLDGRLSAFYGLDVMGHGIFSSLVAYSLHERLRALARERESGAFLSPAALVRRLNEDYSNGSESKPFFTILYGILDGESGEYRLVRAGHPPVLLLPSEGGAPRRLEGGGAAIGFLDELEIAEYSGRLEPGDRLLVASDGYFEASGGRDFGASVEALLAWLGSHGKETTAGLLESLRRLALAGGPCAGLGDDASLLLVERRETRAGEARGD